MNTRSFYYVKGDKSIMNETVKIANPKQASLYMKNGLECKCYWSIDKVIYEFNRDETKPLFDLWCKRELK